MRKLIILGATIVTMLILLSSINYVATDCQIVPQPSIEYPTQAEIQLKKFSSYEELKNFIKASLQQSLVNSSWSYVGGVVFSTGTPTLTIETVINADSTASYYSHSYSATNVQVSGVDEADIVKTDGEYIYVISGTVVVILKAYPPEEARILAQINISQNAIPKQLFLNANKLIVIGSSCYRYRTAMIVDDKIFVNVYDISNITSPVLTRNFSISGGYLSARMVGEYVYIVVTQPLYLIYDTLILPKIYNKGGIKEISACDIYYTDVLECPQAFTTIISVNVQNDEQEPIFATFLLGATSCMYVSAKNVYLTFPDWKLTKTRFSTARTLVYRISIDGATIEYKADGEVPGRVLNQFSMDEYENYFRVATTTSGNGETKNNIYILDMSLEVVGKLEDLALNENIYSARFMGDRCYLVTFRQIDPFFVIDLKNPTSPKLLGELKIPGYSSYLHPYDENHVIGIGKEGANLKISFFDVTNPENPQEIDKYVLNGSYSDSYALSDHKAVLFDRLKKLFVIPVYLQTHIYSYWQTTGYGRWQGVYVFQLGIEEGIALRGKITHLENDNTSWYSQQRYFVKRSLYIDNVLYTVSNKKIKMNSLENLEELNEIELPYSDSFCYKIYIY